MPMLYTPKPRQFKYSPRLYDPEKEEWEQLKTKYRLKHGLPLSDNVEETETAAPDTVSDKDLEYFQRRVREMDRKEKEESQHLTINDLFRKREKPQFHYVSRFDENGEIIETPATATKENAHKPHITRRFDNDDDDGRLKPIPAGKIIIYTLAVCLLLLFIFG